MNKIYSEDKFFEFIEENVKNVDDDWNAGYSLLKSEGRLEIPAESMNNGIATVLEWSDTKFGVVVTPEMFTFEIEYETEKELSVLQKTVGGYIESHNLFGMTCYVNDDPAGLTYNPDLHIWGNIFFPDVTFEEFLGKVFE